MVAAEEETRALGLVEASVVASLVAAVREEEARAEEAWGMVMLAAALWGVEREGGTRVQVDSLELPPELMVGS